MAIIHDMSFVNDAMIPRPTLSNVPAALSVLGISRNPEHSNVSANVLIIDNDIDEFSEGVSDKAK